MDQRHARGIYGHGIVATSLKCRQCGYELRGLNASGLCPECGLSIWASVQHATDPEGTRLPQLRNPKAVGGAMLWLVAASLCASILWVARPTASWLDRVFHNQIGSLSGWVPPQPRLLASLLVLSALGAVWRLSPPRNVNESGIVRRDLRLLFVGLVFSGLAMLELTFASTLQLRLPQSWSDGFELAIGLSLIFFLIIALVGLQGVLRLIGQRSRQYRTARDGRQNVHGLIAVLGFVGLGLVLEQIPRGVWPSEGFWSSLSMVMVAISYLMLVVGLGYLLMNMLWIRSALRKQPPTLDELLLPPKPSIPTDTRMPNLDTKADRLEIAARRVHDDAANSNVSSTQTRQTGTTDQM